MALDRSAVLDAIRSGARTAQEISAKLAQPMQPVRDALRALRESGDIVQLGIVHSGSCRPRKTWRVVMRDKVPIPRKRHRERKPRNISPEVKARFSELLKKRRADPELEQRRVEALKAAREARAIKVPPWVVPSHRKIYRNIAWVLGEDDAARYARAAKELASRYRPDLVPRRASAQLEPR